jgi:hypothetical protein
MSIVDRPSKTTLPPLVAGQSLDQATFHARYEAMPPETWAELVGGIVYMPSPLRYEHGTRDVPVSYWLGHYQRFTKGVESARNATTILGERGEVQPDSQLRIPEELEGQTRIVGGYVTGGPELVAEIAGSSRSYDLGAKKRDYERAGVSEYIVIELDPDRIHWFILRGGHFEELEPGVDGIYRSEVFPGLWLDPQAQFGHDLERLARVVELGIATPEHAAFVTRMEAARNLHRTQS